MKNLLYLFAAILLVACSGEEPADDDNNDDQTNVEDTLTYPDSMWVEEVDTNEVEFFIEDMPSKWVMLSDPEENGENLVINSWCDAETPFFEFEADKGESYNVLLAYGQDGEICELMYFEAFEKEEELMQVVSGELRFKAEYDDIERVVDFWWNKDEKVAHFEGMGMQSSWFVPEEDMNNYEIIEEDCEGLWE